MGDDKLVLPWNCRQHNVFISNIAAGVFKIYDGLFSGVLIIPSSSSRALSLPLTVSMYCLQVVRFGTLWSERVLDAIDGLGIKELYVGSRLAKTYPGSTKIVKKLSFWQEVSAL